jgi:probable addiction module antidote protein
MTTITKNPKAATVAKLVEKKPARRTALNGAAAAQVVVHLRRRAGAAMAALRAHGGVAVVTDASALVSPDLVARIRAKTTPHDPARYLKTEKGMAAYLEAALQEGDPRGIAMALGNIARAKGMTDLARETGLNRESLYRALSQDGNPEMSTVIKVLKALGLRLHATAAV